MIAGIDSCRSIISPFNIGSSLHLLLIVRNLSAARNLSSLPKGRHRGLIQNRDGGKRNRCLLLAPVLFGEHIGRHDDHAATGLHHPRAADEPISISRREQVELVFGREDPLPWLENGRGGNSRAVVDQKSRDAAVEQAVLLEEIVAEPCVRSSIWAPTRRMKP
jgi:hypothetical protein